jgi:hypothetical protein
MLAGKKVGFLLEGDTHEDLCWDLVEMIFDDPISGHLSAFRGGSSETSGSMLVSYDSIFPSLSRTLSYHEARFSEEWWAKQEWMLIDFLGSEKANGMEISDIRTLFPKETLLMMYMSSIIGRKYATFHGIPDRPLTPKIAVEYFEKLGYLQWLEVTDPRVLGNLKI